MAQGNTCNISTTEQINDFAAFALTVTQQEGEDISLDAIFERWWQERHRDEDLIAIKEVRIGSARSTRSRGTGQFPKRSSYRQKVLSYVVRILPVAAAELKRIFNYIQERSPQGAESWEAA